MVDRWYLLCLCYDNIERHIHFWVVKHNIFQFQFVLSPPFKCFPKCIDLHLPSSYDELHKCGIRTRTHVQKYLFTVLFLMSEVKSKISTKVTGLREKLHSFASIQTLTWRELFQYILNEATCVQRYVLSKLHASFHPC